MLLVITIGLKVEKLLNKPSKMQEHLGQFFVSSKLFSF